MCGKVKNKKALISLLMFVFKRGMVFLSKKDKQFADIISNFPDGFSFSLVVKNSDLFVSFIKYGGVLKVNEKVKPDLILTLNNLCSALLVFSGIISQHTAFAEHRIAVKGNISDALVATMAINRLQSVIFPDFISKRLIKNFSGSTTKEKVMFVKFYICGMFRRV